MTGEKIKWLLQKQKQKVFNIDDIDFNKILVSKKEPYGKKDIPFMVMMIINI